MSQTKNMYFIGKGTAYLRRRVEGAHLMPVGNASALSLAFEPNKVELPDYENAGGGIADSHTRIQGVTASFTIANMNADNIARATAGRFSTKAGGGVAGEEHVAGPEGSFLRFDKIPNADKPITISSSAVSFASWEASSTVAVGDKVIAGGKVFEATVGGTTDASEPVWPSITGDTVEDGDVTWKLSTDIPEAFVEGQDYEVKNGGVIILDGEIKEGDTVFASYDALDSSEVEALLEMGEEYELYFDGLNEANSNLPHLVTCHRVKLSPTSELPLISEDYAQINVTVDVLYDETIRGSQRSKYVKIEMAQKAS